MYIRLGFLRFPNQVKADAYIAMNKGTWFEKLDKETLNKEQFLVSTGEGRVAQFGIYDSEEDFNKTGKELKKLFTEYIKQFDGIIEMQAGKVVAHYKRE